MQKQKCSAPDKNDVLLPVDWKGGKPDVRKILGKFFFFFFAVPFLVLFLNCFVDLRKTRWILQSLLCEWGYESSFIQPPHQSKVDWKKLHFDWRLASSHVLLVGCDCVLDAGRNLGVWSAAWSKERAHIASSHVRNGCSQVFVGFGALNRLSLSKHYWASRR